jgi:hypothetical protein
LSFRGRVLFREDRRLVVARQYTLEGREAVILLPKGHQATGVTSGHTIPPVVEALGATLKLGAMPDEVGGSVSAKGRARLWVGYDGTVWRPMLDCELSRFRPPSIAGLVVGAMGCFIFGLYLRRWLKARREAA